MFVLYNKRTNNKEFIYGVQKNASGYADFLIRKGSEWRWVSAKNYITICEWEELSNFERKSRLNG